VLLFAAIIILVVYNIQQNTTTQEALTINELAEAIKNY
jgi:biopolymer transport protein ExbB/TolQ